ncbi:hypothetical protein [Nostoc sp. C052]|uniref:hypothetical protein n=1 Tax=Nostoc sp. C052 TaxID=2576902 RepID=UPI0035642035
MSKLASTAPPITCHKVAMSYDKPLTLLRRYCAAIGCGLWQMGLLGGLLTLITLSGVKRLNRAFVFLTSQGKQGSTQDLATTSDEDDD